MLDNIVFAFNATIPLFILMAVGYGLRRVNVVNEEFIKKASAFNFKVTIPAMLFADMASSDFRETFDWKFLVFCVAGTLITIFGAWGGAKLFMKKDKASVGEFVQGCYRSSLAITGMALVESVCGSVSTAGMMMLCSVPFYNIFAVVILKSESPDENIRGSKDGRLKSTLLGIVKNPIIISILAGFVSSMIGIDYPQFIDTSLEYVGRIATPFALMLIGADFSFRSAFAKLGKSGIASAIKLIITPLIFLPLAVLFGFRNDALVAILIMFASPSTAVGFVMAKQYGHEGTITSSCVALTTLFASLTLALFIFALRQMGFI